MAYLIEGSTGAWEVVIGLEVHAQVICKPLDDEIIFAVGVVLERAFARVGLP
jgi:hypothetical protein